MNENESRVPIKRDTDESLKEYQLGLNGLEKLDSLSYLNPVIQCLSNIPQLRDFYLSGSYKRHMHFLSNDQENLSRIFSRVLRLIWSQEPRIVSLNRLKVIISTFYFTSFMINPTEPLFLNRCPLRRLTKVCSVAITMSLTNCMPSCS